MVTNEGSSYILNDGFEAHTVKFCPHNQFKCAARPTPNMKAFSDEEQQTSDIDWYAFDSQGKIAHFASAGRMLPKTVAEARVATRALNEYFRSLDRRQGTAQVHPHLWRHIQICEQKREAFLKDYTSLGERGLYSFHAAEMEASEPYVGACIPLLPLSVQQLPPEMQAYLSRFRLRGRSIAERSGIHENDIDERPDQSIATRADPE